MEWIFLRLITRLFLGNGYATFQVNYEMINNKDRKKLKLNKLESSKFGDEWEAKMLWLCNFIASSYRYFFQTV